MEQRNFKSDMNIDPHQLDREWIEHCNMYAYWSEQHVLALKNEEELKAQLKVLVARRDRAIRADPEEYGAETKKLTEAQIASIVTCEPDVIELTARVRKASTNTATLLAARQGLDHRRKALEELGRLQAQGYYGSTAMASIREGVDGTYLRMPDPQMEGLNKTPNPRIK